MENYNIIKDLDGRVLELGHIVGVRYVWNSYVGEVTMKGLSATGSIEHAFFGPHSFNDDATYQVFGHTNENHPNFNLDVLKWYKDNIPSKCPVEIRLYKTKGWKDACENAEKELSHILNKQS